MPLELFLLTLLNTLCIKRCKLSYKTLGSKKFIYIPREGYDRKYLDHIIKFLFALEKSNSPSFFKLIPGKAMTENICS